jgi:hypothetical protein
LFQVILLSNPTCRLNSLFFFLSGLLNDLANKFISMSMVDKITMLKRIVAEFIVGWIAANPIHSDPTCKMYIVGTGNAAVGRWMALQPKLVFLDSSGKEMHQRTGE